MLCSSKMDISNTTELQSRPFFYLEADSRSEEWFPMQSPAFVAFVIIAYLAMVKKIGPDMMKGRKEFKLEKAMQCYNVFQIVVCGVMVALSLKPLMNFNPLCARLPFTNEYMINARLAYAYFWLKIVDLFDTVIFVLRKKDAQITFLHIFHHAYLVFLSYMHVKYLPGTNIPVLTVLNCTVHVIMYYYYLVTSITKRTLWWKKYLTSIQLIQLSLMVVFNVLSFFNPYCSFPRFALIFVNLAPNVLLVTEFARFYRRSYNTKKQPTTTTNATTIKVGTKDE